MRALQDVAVEALRGLHRHEVGARDGRHDGTTRAVARGDALDRVHHRQPRHDGGVPGTHGVDDPGDQLRRGERPRGVVHQHHVDVVDELGEPRGHRLLTCAPPTDHVEPDVGVRGVDHVAEQGRDLDEARRQLEA